MKDHYNAASRLAGGAEFDCMTNIENIAWSGLPSDAVTGVRHKVRVTDHETGEVLEVNVRSRHVLRGGAGRLGAAQRVPHGCCTKCAVVTSGTLNSQRRFWIRSTGRAAALLCVPALATWVVTQDEEVYQMQFGELFEQLATDKNAGSVLRTTSRWRLPTWTSRRERAPSGSKPGNSKWIVCKSAEIQEEIPKYD